MQIFLVQFANSSEHLLQKNAKNVEQNLNKRKRLSCENVDFITLPLEKIIVYSTVYQLIGSQA